MSVTFYIDSAGSNGEFVATINAVDKANNIELGATTVHAKKPDEIDAVTSRIEELFGSGPAGEFRLEFEYACTEHSKFQTAHDHSSDNKSKSWPMPISLASPLVPALPKGIFTHWLGDYIYEVAASVEVPPELPAAFAIVAVSSMVQGRFTVRVKPDYFEPLNVWMLCAMQSGNRKSDALKKTVFPLVEWEQKKAAELLPEIERATSARKTLEVRITRLRSDAAKATPEKFPKLRDEISQLESELVDIPKAPLVFSQDVTPENTGTLLADNDERLSLISDEGGLFDNMGGRYNNNIPNLDVYLQSHAGSFVRVHRGSRPPVNLMHPALSIAISPQPEVLAGLSAHTAFRGRGLLARFAYMLPASPLGYRTGLTTPISDRAIAEYREGLFALGELPMARNGDREVPSVLNLSNEAGELWRDFWVQNEIMLRPDEKLGRLKDFGGKLPGLVARISGLLHCVAYASCADTHRQIDATTMQRAIKFGEYLIEHALAAFSIMGADSSVDAARDIWKTIESSHRRQFSVRDAWHPNRGKYKKVSDIEPGFDVLIDHGYIREPHQADDPDAPRRRGRPPSRLLEVNPALTEGWK